MKFVLTLVLALTFACVSGQTSADVDRILASADSAAAAGKCVISFTPDCGPILEKFSKIAPTIIENGGECDSCTDEENELLKKLVDGMVTKYPKVFKDVINKIKAQNNIST